jgi:hypothetical protein
MTNLNYTENDETVQNEEYEIISSNEKCIKCRFQYKIILDELNQINISCRHPKGPGNPVHCIYFKQVKNV